MSPVPVCFFRLPNTEGVLHFPLKSLESHPVSVVVPWEAVWLQCGIEASDIVGILHFYTAML